MPDLVTPPLTKLSEEEELFRDTVRDFAEREVRPRVAAMERASAVDPALLAKCFELGLMGIDIPESHGGAGGSLLMTVLAVEELSAVDAVSGDLRGRPEHPREHTARSGRAMTSSAASSPAWRATCWARTPVEPDSGSTRSAQTRATTGERVMLEGRQLWITNGAEAGLFVAVRQQ